MGERRVQLHNMVIQRYYTGGNIANIYLQVERKKWCTNRMFNAERIKEIIYSFENKSNLNYFLDACRGAYNSH